MWCIAGLGNPGPRYRWSRHNVGFLCIDRLSAASRIGLNHKNALVEWGRGGWLQESVLLCRPLTFMNLSGRGIQSVLSERGGRYADLLVIHDDLDLEPGRLKFKKRGGDGGHKGIRSVAQVLGADRFIRLRIGVGRPPNGVDPAHYVLEPFEEDEREVIDDAMDRAVQAVETLLRDGIESAMARFHVKSG